MAGRNNRPDKTGPAAQPSRLDQFGAETRARTDGKPAQACGEGAVKEDK